MFEIFDCTTCPNYLKDESVFIGDMYIHIYRSKESCKNDEETPFDVFTSKKIRLFLKDLYLNQNKDLLFLWLDEVYEDYETLMAFDQEVHMLVTN